MLLTTEMCLMSLLLEQILYYDCKPPNEESFSLTFYANSATLANEMMIDRR